MKSSPLLLLLILMVLSCTKPPDYPDEPVIGFISFSKNQIVQDPLGLNDTTYASFSFTDGDGDLGHNDSLNVFITDTRDGFEIPGNRIPFVPEQGASNGINGEITIMLLTTCCYYENGLPPCEPSTSKPTDTLRYEIYIKDRAGNRSNIITTDDLIVLCN